jgi:uncharacterized protein YyaL (SSP411 family)
MDERAAASAVEWSEFGPEAFARAAEADSPLLLSLTTPWCEWCRRMDETTYGDPRIAGHLADGFVPVRVDADRFPRVRERYNAGGFPSTVFCTPSGEIVSAAGHLEPDGMRQVLERVRETWTEKGASAGRVPRALREEPPAGPVEERIVRLLVGQLEEKYDGEFGGWGTEAKFPLPRTVEFALKRDRARGVAALRVANRNLQSPDGSFGRYAGSRDWSDVQTETLLDAHAGLVRANANAYLLTGDDEFREAAEDGVTYLRDTLAVEGGFGGSESTDGVDGTVFADRNARVADACLTLYGYTDSGAAREAGERALDAVEGLVDDSGLPAHHADAPAYERGALADAAAAVGAFTTAAEVLDPAYAETATGIADAAIDELREGDAFVDGPREGPGLLSEPLRPLDGNAELADALVTLSYLVGESGYREVARAAAGAFAGAAERIGVQVAGYGTAVSRLVDPPLRIRVGETGSDLHRAALRLADHEKVVVPGNETGATVVTAEGEFGPADDPEELATLVSERA